MLLHTQPGDESEHDQLQRRQHELPEAVRQNHNQLLREQHCPAPHMRHKLVQICQQPNDGETQQSNRYIP